MTDESQNSRALASGLLNILKEQVTAEADRTNIAFFEHSINGMWLGIYFGAKEKYSNLLDCNISSNALSNGTAVIFSVDFKFSDDQFSLTEVFTL